LILELARYWIIHLNDYTWSVKADASVRQRENLS